jgi:adenosine deaminase
MKDGYSYHPNAIGKMESFIHDIPKAELHLHIEGTLEPELMFELARENAVAIPYRSVADVRNAYRFSNLQSFLDIYYQGAQVLIDEDDFYRLTVNYLKKAAEQNVRHAEIFFDPQTHTARGIRFETIVQGIHRALTEARQHLDMSTGLIMCFLRDRGASEAMETLEQALPFKDRVLAVGLDSSELGYPPEDFASVFERAREHGFKVVAHAGEEGPPEYIWQALKVLKVERIDHGVRCIEDERLMQYLSQNQIPLTVCPLSNVKLRVFESMDQHNFKRLMDAGLRLTVNSDDPSYFGGYIVENLLALVKAFDLSQREIIEICRNGFEASFLDTDSKQNYQAELDAFVSGCIGGGQLTDDR